MIYSQPNDPAKVASDYVIIGSRIAPSVIILYFGSGKGVVIWGKVSC
jgi:hypothetical protein